MVGSPVVERDDGAVIRGASDKYLLAALSHGISRSSDNGETWAPTEFPKTIWAWALATSGSRVVAGGCPDSSDCEIHISSDSGASWKKTAYKGSASIRSLALSGSDIWAGTEAGGMARTSDDGSTWTPLSFPGGKWGGIKALVVSGANLLAAAEDGMFISSDKGATWRQGRPEPTRSLAVSDSEVLALLNSDLYGSWDNGETWTRILLGSGGAIVSTGNRIIAGLQGDTFVGSVLTSSDKGRTWALAGEGWSGRLCESLVVSNGFVFASVAPGNIWRLPLSAL